MCNILAASIINPKLFFLGSLPLTLVRALDVKYYVYI